MPLKYLNDRVKKRVAKLPATSSRVYGIKAGGNASEWTFSAIKRNLTRLNLQRATSTAKLNFLSASWLSHDCSLAGVAKAIKIYQDAIRNTSDPQNAFKNIDWLTKLEPDC